MITVLAIYAIGCLLINADATVTVNAAYTADSITGNYFPTYSRFIITNVTVKNNGNNPLTISSTDFSLLSNGEYIGYLNFYGHGTDVPENVQIPPGENKSFLLVFDVEDKDPEILEYNSLWDPFSEPETSGMGPVNIIPNPNSYANYEVKGKVNEKSYQMDVNITYKSTTNGQIEENIKRSGETIWLTGSVYREPIQSQSWAFDPETFEDENGTYSSYIFLPRGFVEGDSVPIKGSEGENVGEETVTGSKTINIMGKKIECWVTTAKEEEEGIKLQITRYYDKTTGLLLKEVYKEEGSAYGVSYTDSNTMQLTSTNIPLIGIS
ncbi:MAG: DUF4352 domain-containing protein [Methanothermobacter sp.]|nr:DUF4352 domain-containing protein [Methanothermobacter sp.]